MIELRMPGSGRVWPVTPKGNGGPSSPILEGPSLVPPESPLYRPGSTGGGVGELTGLCPPPPPPQCFCRLCGAKEMSYSETAQLVGRICDRGVHILYFPLSIMPWRHWLQKRPFDYLSLQKCRQIRDFNVDFWKIFWGHGPQTHAGPYWERHRPLGSAARSVPPLTTGPPKYFTSTTPLWARHFCPKIMYEKLTKCPNFTWQLPEKYFPELGGGARAPLTPVSYAYGWWLGWHYNAVCDCGYHQVILTYFLNTVSRKQRYNSQSETQFWYNVYFKFI